MTPDLDKVISDHHVAKIKVIGVGGCGCNLVNYMSQRHAVGVEFVAVNTDSQALAAVQPEIECIQIGGAETEGLGTGGKPNVSREAALADISRLRDVVSGMNMVFVVAGMGKGTGTGASPVIAEIAREQDILTVALVVMPFAYENRDKVAEEGLQALSKQADALIVAPNEKLREVLGAKVSMKQAYLAANDLLYNAVCGISDIINKPGMVNVDFNDVRTAMAGKGKAVIGSALATGEDRARVAAESALRSELMETVDLAGAAHILMNVTSNDVSIEEMEQAVQCVKEIATDLRGQVTSGLALDESMGDEVRVTIIITGVRDQYQPKILNNPEVKGTANPGNFFESGRRPQTSHSAGHNDSKQHRTPAVLRRQQN